METGRRHLDRAGSCTRPASRHRKLAARGVGDAIDGSLVISDVCWFPGDSCCGLGTVNEETLGARVAIKRQMTDKAPADRLLLP